MPARTSAAEAAGNPPHIGSRPAVCFVGPMLGRNPGWVTTQGEILADRFAAEDWTVRETSRLPSRPLRLLDTLSCLVRWRRSIDVVVLSVFSGPAFVMADLTSLLTRLLRLPTIMWLHGGNLPTFEQRHPTWVKRVLRRAELVVSPSTFLASVSGDATASEVIPNLIDLDGLPYRPRTTVQPRLLWMRTFHPIYNPGLAVRSFDRLGRNHPDASLTMAGQEKGLTSDVRAEVERLGHGTSVTFPGFLGPNDKWRVFSEHDIYLHTNHIDNTPVSVLEAAAAGLPIVATAVGGIPHLLHDGQDALLVPDDDAEAMAAAIDRLLTEPGLADRLARNARALAEASAWPPVRERWLAAFDRVLAQP